MGYIKSHNYKPEYEFRNIDGDEQELYMGVELEVDIGGENDSTAGVVLSILDDNNRHNAYCVHDGSLNGGGNGHETTGFEIVTMPCTLAYHKTLSYKKAFDFLISEGYKSHDTTTCGLHVHVNRTYFGDNKLAQDLNICKLLYLLEKYWDQIITIARRDTCFYSRRFYLGDNESPIDLYSKSKARGKYAAVNLIHEDTIELRMFKGTLNYETYMCTLEFVHQFCQLVKRVDIYDIQMVKWSDIEDTFSDALKVYIADRIEKDAKKAQKAAEEKARAIEVDTICSAIFDSSSIINSRRPTQFGLSSSPMSLTSRGERLSPLTSDFITTSYEPYVSSGRPIVSFNNINPPNVLTHISTSTVQEFTTQSTNTTATLSEIEQVKLQIKRLKARIDFARNELERLNLRRTLANMQGRLLQLNRENRESARI